jgi:translation initiation factor IF-1
VSGQTTSRVSGIFGGPGKRRRLAVAILAVRLTLCQLPRALAVQTKRVEGRHFRDLRQSGRFEQTMSKGDLLEMEGVIQDALGGGQYTIRVDQGGAIVRAQLSGRMRRHHIRVLPGDRVRVAVSPYDLSHGLIVYRGRT